MKMERPNLEICISDNPDERPRLIFDLATNTLKLVTPVATALENIEKAFAELERRPMRGGVVV